VLSAVKVGKSNGKETFAGMRGNDKVAPIAAIHEPVIEPGSSPKPWCVM
jgi:hypothetical protein